MKKFLCKLLKCCPAPAYSMEDAIRQMGEVISPVHSFRISDLYEKSGGFQPDRHFEIVIYGSRFMFVRDESLEVAVKRILAEYRLQP